MEPVYVVGCDRSGTTLLGAMLGGHSRTLCIPEAQFFHELVRLYYKSENPLDLAEVIKTIKAHWRFKIWEFDFSEDEIINECDGVRELNDFIRVFINHYASSLGKPGITYWIDHTPSNVRYAYTLSQVFPESRFIHIVRDVRGVAASVMPLPWGPNDVLEASKIWKEQLAYGLVSEMTLGPEKVIRVKFENLLEKPLEVIEKLCSWLRIDFDPAMLDGLGYRMPRFNHNSHRLVSQKPDTRRAYAWQTSLSGREIEIIEAETCDLLMLLGYEQQYGFPARSRTTGEKYSMIMKSFLTKTFVNKIKFSFHRKRAIKRQAIVK